MAGNSPRENGRSNYNHHQWKKSKEEWEAEQAIKLSKRVSYLLRYGAEKEGVTIYEGGYVKLEELLECWQLKYQKPSDVLKLILTSISPRGVQRYEQKVENNIVYIRAIYGRRMERHPCHDDSKVVRLMEMCMKRICDNLEDYDLDGFPDEFLLNTMIHRLRREKRLSNKAFRVLLTDTIEHLDLGYVYLTESTLKLVGQRCPHLKVLNLRECGYVATDHMMEMLLKKTPLLESINFSGCHHLTDRTISAICKNLKHINQINFTRVNELSEAAIIKLITNCASLKHLDIYDNKKITHQGRAVIKDICETEGRDLKVVLAGLEVAESDSDPSYSLQLAGVGQYW